MLKSVSVSGFRSLKNFALEIRSGLNVLVGPNGAGKTNIILFFEFLRAIASSGISEAVGKAGGVAQVFTKKGEKKFSPTLHADMTGEVFSEDLKYTYSYSFKVEFSQSKQEVFFSEQKLLISKHEKDGRTSIHLRAIFSTDEKGEAIGTITSPKASKEKDWIQSEFPQWAKRGLFVQRSIVSMLFHSDRVCEEVSRDLLGRFVLNVVPSHVKRPEDSTRSPGIEADGTGLSATLYAIKKKKPFFEDHMVYYASRRPKPILPSWQSVIDLIRVAVPSIEDLDVESDPFDNLLKCRVKIGRGSKQAVLPLAAMSDGTVKWISLVLRLSTSSAALLLEEPENYLHPLMQREIVTLLRDAVSKSGFMLVSTHSETLLNSVRAEELIVVNYTPSGTTANRVTNAADVESEINATGFGLGYYYLTDSVES